MDKLTMQTENLADENFRSYHKITVSVFAKGDGDKIISSQKAEYVWTNPNK